MGFSWLRLEQRLCSLSFCPHECIRSEVHPGGVIEGRCLVNGRMVLTIGYCNVFCDMFALINYVECTCRRARSLRRRFGSRRRARSRAVTSVFRHSNRALLYTDQDSVLSQLFDYLTPACDSRRRRLTGTTLRTRIWIQRDSI
jgi:hypothetical protein